MESTLYIGVESIYAKYRFENASIAPLSVFYIVGINCAKKRIPIPPMD
jgi:hypothetical protein